MPPNREVGTLPYVIHRGVLYACQTLIADIDGGHGPGRVHNFDKVPEPPMTTWWHGEITKVESHDLLLENEGQCAPRGKKRL